MAQTRSRKYERYRAITIWLVVFSLAVVGINACSSVDEGRLRSDVARSFHNSSDGDSIPVKGLSLEELAALDFDTDVIIAKAGNSSTVPEFYTGKFYSYRTQRQTPSW